jgi:hypothetical protein
MQTNLLTNCITYTIIVQQCGHMDTLLQDVASGNGLVVSDGSYKDGHAAGGWIILSLRCFPQHRIEGSIISPGQAIDQDFHHAEASACLGH